MFQPEYEDVLKRWIDDLKVEVPPILDWWRETEARLNARSDGLASAHWPAGPASHPRIIALYRKYYFEVHNLNQRDEAGDGGGALDESAWGSQDEDPDADFDPVAPATLLLAAVSDYDAETGAFLQAFGYSPIGEDDDLEPS